MVPIAACGPRERGGGSSSLSGVAVAHPAQGRLADRGPTACDADAEIDARIALQRDEGREAHRRIGFGVDHDDQLAAPAQQLVDAEILDVAAVGEVDSSLFS